MVAVRGGSERVLAGALAAEILLAGLLLLLAVKRSPSIVVLPLVKTTSHIYSIATLFQTAAHPIGPLYMCRQLQGMLQERLTAALAGVEGS